MKTYTVLGTTPAERVIVKVFKAKWRAISFYKECIKQGSDVRIQTNE